MARIDLNTGLLQIDRDEDGSRLDKVLMRYCGAERRTLILRLIRKGNVRINRKRASPASRVRNGDQVFLPASLRQNAATHPRSPCLPARLKRQVEALSILYEDEDLLAIHKPNGMVVHGGSHYAYGLIEALKEIRREPDLRLAHRLDRDTSGVLLIAKNLRALRGLTDAFRTRAMQKIYFALVAGHPRRHAGRLHGKLSKGIVVGGERMVVNADTGKEAITDYQVMMHLQQGDLEYAMLALQPHSGRTHQLRVQLAEAGHAILGDDKYGERARNQAFRSLGGNGMALHAWRLRFRHPLSGRLMDIRASIPASWIPLLKPSR